MNEQFKLNGEMVRDFLRSRQLKQSFLTRELDCSGSLVTQMLVGHVPQEKTLRKLAALLGLQVSDLLVPKNEQNKQTA